MCCAEEPGGFAVTAGLAGQHGEALEDVGDEQVSLDFAGTCERVVGVAFGLVRLTLRDRHPGARRQRHRQVTAGCRRDGVVGPAAGRDQIPARQRGLGTEARPAAAIWGKALSVRPGLGASRAVAASPAARAAQPTPSRPGPRQSAKLGGGLDGRVGGVPGRSRVTLVRQRGAVAREANRLKEPIVSCPGLGHQLAELCGGTGRSP